MTYALPNLQTRDAARYPGFSRTGRAKLDALGAYYPASLGDICSCRTNLSGLGASGQMVAFQSINASGQGFAAGGPIGAVVAGTVSLISSWLNRVGPKQKVATTEVVNQAEPLLQANLAAWNASPKTCADQEACLAAFDVIWSAVVQHCAVPEMGDPGHSCVDDRMPEGVEFEWNTLHLVGNGRWNWFSYYRDPIANDPAAADCCPLLPCYVPECVPAPRTGCVARVDAPVVAAGAGGSEDVAVASAAPTASAAAGGSGYLLLAGLLVGAAVIAGRN